MMVMVTLPDLNSRVAIPPPPAWWYVPFSDDPQPPRASPKANTAPVSKRVDCDETIFPSRSELRKRDMPLAQTLASDLLALIYPSQQAGVNFGVYRPYRQERRTALRAFAGLVGLHRPRLVERHVKFAGLVPGMPETGTLDAHSN